MQSEQRLLYIWHGFVKVIMARTSTKIESRRHVILPYRPYSTFVSPSTEYEINILTKPLGIS
jgi:hypothetical protein